MHSGHFGDGLPQHDGIDNVVPMHDDGALVSDHVDEHQLLNQLFGMVNSHPSSIMQPMSTALQSLDVCDDIDRLKAILIHSEDHETYSLLVNALTETSILIQNKRLLLQRLDDAIQEQDTALQEKIEENVAEIHATISERAKQFLATKQEVADATIATALADVFVKLIPEVNEDDQQVLKTLYNQFGLVYGYGQADQGVLDSQYGYHGASDEHLTELLNSENTMAEHTILGPSAPAATTTEPIEPAQIAQPQVPSAVPDAPIDPITTTTIISTDSTVAVVSAATVVAARKPTGKRKAPEPGGEVMEQSPAKRAKTIEADLSNLTKPFSAASILKLKSIKIGNWYLETSDAVQITARVYHAKKQFVWMFLDSTTEKTQKMQLNFADVDAILFNTIADRASTCAITFQLNCPPAFFMEVDDPKYTHNKPWVKCLDFTQGNQASLCLEHVITLDKNFFVNRYNALSHYEKLMLGDPYLCSVARADALFPPVGKDATVIGLRTWSQLRDRFISFLKIIEQYIQEDGIDAHVSHLNPNILHKFKFRASDAPSEPSVAINLDDTLAMIKRRNDVTFGKDEIWYVLAMGKIGENSLGLFYTNAAAAAAARERGPQELDEAEQQGGDGEDDPNAPPRKKKVPKGRPGSHKLIRSCCLLCKERLPYILGTNLPEFVLPAPPPPPPPAPPLPNQ